MPNYQESIQYAQERLGRIQHRFRWYTGSYHITRAANSATRRMTNIRKLQSWENVLREAGYEQAADYARERWVGLENGTVAAPVRRRLGRTQVTRYEPIPPIRPDATGRSYVEYEYSAGTDDV